MENRTIKNFYDKEKFDKGVKEAAKIFVHSVMGSYADSEYGENSRRQIEENLKKQLSEVPIEYYRTLESFIDGKDFMEYVEFVGDRNTFEYFQKQGASGLIDLISAHAEGTWRIKDVEAETRYYNELFPPEKEKNAEETPNIPAQTAQPAVVDRTEAIRLADARLKTFDADNKRSAKELNAKKTQTRKQYDAYMQTLKKQDPVGYKKLSVLHKIEDKELKELQKLNAKVLKETRKSIRYEELNFQGALTKKEDKKYKKNLALVREANRKKENYADTLDALNQERLHKNEITQEHFVMYMSQIAGGDDTYRAMMTQEQAHAAGQLGFGDIAEAFHTEKPTEKAVGVQEKVDFAREGIVFKSERKRSEEPRIQEAKAKEELIKS